MADKKVKADAATGDKQVPGVVIAQIVTQLIALGIQEAPIITALINTQDTLGKSDHPDVTDEVMATIRQLIVDLQAKINAA